VRVGSRLPELASGHTRAPPFHFAASHIAHRLLLATRLVVGCRRAIDRLGTSMRAITRESADVKRAVEAVNNAARRVSVGEGHPLTCLERVHSGALVPTHGPMHRLPQLADLEHEVGELEKARERDVARLKDTPRPTPAAMQAAAGTLTNAQEALTAVRRWLVWACCCTHAIAPPPPPPPQAEGDCARSNRARTDLQRRLEEAKLRGSPREQVRNLLHTRTRTHVPRVPALVTACPSDPSMCTRHHTAPAASATCRSHAPMPLWRAQALRSNNFITCRVAMAALDWVRSEAAAGRWDREVRGPLVLHIDTEPQYQALVENALAGALRGWG